MDFEVLFYTALILAPLGWLMWRANNPKKKPEPHSEPEGITFTKGPGQPAPDADPFLDAVEAERTAAERRLRLEQEAYRKAIEAQVLDDEHLKTKLTKFAQENKLDIAIAELWDEMHHYPTWAKRTDWPETNTLGIENPREDDAPDFRDKPLHFAYQETDYTIVPRKWSGMEDGSYMDFQLMENGEEVFAVTCAYEYDYVATYRPISVNAFKKRGNWASMLIQLFAKMKFESEKRSADWRAKAASDIKERFSE
jgi:hypothetical protein